MTNEAVELFYSYAPEDKKLLTRLDAHLTLLQHSGVISTWSNHDIRAGSLQAEEIQTHLKRAKIILLLISPAFLASDCCYSVEMQEALRRQETGQARIIPILLRPVDWEQAPFRHLKALPKNGKAVTIQPNRDAAFAEVAREIRTVVDELQQILSPMTSSDVEKTKKRGKEKQQHG